MSGSGYIGLLRRSGHLEVYDALAGRPADRDVPFVFRKGAMGC